MRFLLDENVEFRIGAFLRSLGHDVTAIAVDYPRALEDSQVLAIAASEERILLTNDRDIGELVVRLRQAHAGVIYFRLPLETSAQEKIQRLARLLETHADRLNQFLVVSPSSVRVRRAP